ncbi:O-antigen polymerase [Turicibacter sanguinis]|uniref:O-antigen polymerase n=1 Tax=Turicibacter sanguinis TaxID=154288 RepID=UPI0021D4BEEA|nr:O-antigen polymerase [Turicibacter sanguinis]MCU7197746.1 oligosaccharide repeat unit polymerase [Turicibacter sanguinis]
MKLVIDKYIFTSIFLIINIVSLYSYNKDSIIFLLILFLLNLLLYVLFLIMKKKTYTIFLDLYFIFAIVFSIYAVCSPIYFILNNYTPAIWFFYVDNNIVYTSFYFYFFTFNIYTILTCIFYKNISELKVKHISKLGEKIIFKSKYFVVFDAIALLSLVILGFNAFRHGLDIFSLTKNQILQITGISKLRYITIYMQIYTIYLGIGLLYIFLNKSNINKKIILKNNSIRIFFCLIYWLILLRIGMRHDFLLVFLCLFIYSMTLIKKMKIKNIILLALSIIFLLFLAYYRAYRLNGNLFSHNFNEIFYSMFGEFILTQYITYFYNLNIPENLLYGISYFLYPLLYLIPGRLFPNKPEVLGLRFINDAHVNVGFAYNPIAESLINFGYNGVLFVPFFIFILLFIIRKFSINNPIFYIAIVAQTVNFCRGQFAVTFFDILFFIVVFKIMYYIGIKK